MIRSLAIALVLAASTPAFAQPTGVTLIGPAGKTIVVEAKALAAGPRQTVTTEIHGKKAVYEALLSSLLAQVDAPTGEKLRGNELSSVVLVTASDGYQIALSLAETDPGMRKGAVILADKADGKPLAVEDGPYRLIVEGDLRPARSARMVTKIEVRRLGEARPPSH